MVVKISLLENVKVHCQFSIAQSPIRLTEKMMRLLDTLVKAEQHRAHLPIVGVQLVLNQGIALVITAGLVVVVVIPVVLKANFARHSAPEAGQFPRVDVGVERNR